MTGTSPSRVIFGLLTSLAAEGAATAQLPVRLGNEFQVNTFTPNSQHQPSIGLDADGDFVVVWQSLAQDASSYGIFGRRFTSSGAAVATEFRINTYTSNSQENPWVAVNAAGGFVVVWSSDDQDNDGWGVFGRRFSAAGAALAVEFQVNTWITGDQQLAGVATDTDGDFVVVWSGSGNGDSLGVFGRRFDASGVAQATEFRANSTLAGSQSLPAVGMDDDGDFVVVWRSNSDIDNDGAVIARRFSSSGSVLGFELQVNTYITGNQTRPAVGVDAEGDFAVSWASYPGIAMAGVFARRFSSAGTSTGAEFQVNILGAIELGKPAIAADADGDFVIVWFSSQDFGSVLARRFKSPATPTTGELTVSLNVCCDGYPAVDAEDYGDFVVAWTGNDGPSASDFGIFARRFDVPITIDVDGDGQFLPLVDGVLILRFGFGFTGNTLITGAVAPGCTRCDAPSITKYLKTLL